MKRTIALYCVATAVAVSLAACSGSSQSPLSPSSVTATDAAANPDGSTLKVTAPALISPVDGGKLDSRRPTFTFSNSSGRFSATSFAYRIELLDAGGNLVDARTVGGGGEGVTAYASDVELPYDTNYQWRVRAEMDGQAGPYSGAGAFRTPDTPTSAAPTNPGAPSTGTVGAKRSIGVSEALGIISKVHNELRWDLGSGSAREARVDFLWSAVAAIHYGHPRFNPAGPDPDWCVKDAGGGRPPSDDVLVACSSREAWDLIGGAGANGYNFHLDYLGRLPGGQNVYPPPASSLGLLGR